jgi:putative hemolysin
MPEPGEKIVCAHWQFEVTELEGRRIDKVRARFFPAALSHPAA